MQRSFSVGVLKQLEEKSAIGHGQTGGERTVAVSVDVCGGRVRLEEHFDDERAIVSAGEQQRGVRFVVEHVNAALVTLVKKRVKYETHDSVFPVRARHMQVGAGEWSRIVARTQLAYQSSRDEHLGECGVVRLVALDEAPDECATVGIVRAEVEREQHAIASRPEEKKKILDDRQPICQTCRAEWCHALVRLSIHVRSMLPD